MKKSVWGTLAPPLFCLGVSTLFSFTTPGGKVPEELTGQWQKGNFPMTHFFTFDGRTPQRADTLSQWGSSAPAFPLSTTTHKIEQWSPFVAAAG